MNDYYKTRNELVNMYIKSLEEGEIPWEKMWTTSIPYNPVSGTVYKGMNNLLLSFIAVQRGYEDPRWCTFLHVQKKNWKLVGAKGMGITVEFACMYNKKEKKTYSFEDYEKIIAENPEREEEFKRSFSHSTLYNAKHIEGIPELENQSKNKIIDNQFINNIISNLGVNYKELGDEAYYNIKEDEVVIPPSNKFKSSYSYYATQLHELAHSTGHQERLNRNMDGKFGSEEYAKEELRAEISSSFFMQKLGLEYDDRHLQNHKAYVKNWLDILKSKPQELFFAISDANKIVGYLEDKSLIKEKDNSKEIDNEMEVELC